MRLTGAYKFPRSILALGFLVVSSGCVIEVEMTSAPDTVRQGEPVTFDLKLTNRSACPVETVAAELLAFIPVDQFFSELIDGSIPSDLTPQEAAFLEQLRMFFDELCSGGEPDLPEQPVLATSCSRGEDEILCTMSGPLPAQQGNDGGMSFTGLRNRLQCEIDGGTISCRLRIPLPNASSTESGGGALATKSLTCLTAEQLGSDVSGALCFIGTFPTMVEGLGPGEMATGQVSLPARGQGFVRNIVMAGAVAGESLGVCKGGSEGGNACDTGDMDACPGSSCGAGICVDGANDGLGCDEATAMMDCPAPGTCEICEELPENGFLPIDCTTTYIAPETVPVMSPWGLGSLAALLFVSGSVWLRRRGRRSASA